MKLKVKVIANSSKQDVKEENGILKVHLKSIPQKGKANGELIEVLSEHFGIKKGQINIIKGLRSNIKEVEIIQ